ncbi:hypothetical protein WG78_13470 [Amantichitinum ursilacus]|uniref:Uncharacterized protein n=1 Tax=Amantichitinum ursilacus TaxID=857265 RepID=A0A0N0GMX4_9NEIS|nr:hypothetical protein WG78_13470 [Amantichitinum ursilacus]
MRIGWVQTHQPKQYAKLTAIANHLVWWVMTHPMRAVHSLFSGCAPTYPQRYSNTASRGEANATDSPPPPIFTPAVRLISLASTVTPLASAACFSRA